MRRPRFDGTLSQPAADGRPRGFASIDRTRAVGPVNGREDRIRASCLLEPSLDSVNAHAHRVTRLVARDAGPPVRSERLEEGLR